MRELGWKHSNIHIADFRSITTCVIIDILGCKSFSKIRFFSYFEKIPLSTRFTEFFFFEGGNMQIRIIFISYPRADISPRNSIFYTNSQRKKREIQSSILSESKCIFSSRSFFFNRLDHICMKRFNIGFSINLDHTDRPTDILEIFYEIFFCSHRKGKDGNLFICFF